MTTYRWTTNKGAAVKMTVANVTEQLENDGIQYNSKPEIKITSLTINGTSYNASFGHCANLGKAMFKVGTQQAAVEIPEEIYNSIYAAQKAAITQAIKTENEYQQHVASVNAKLNV